MTYWKMWKQGLTLTLSYWKLHTWNVLSASDEHTWLLGWRRFLFQLQFKFSRTWLPFSSSRLSELMCLWHESCWRPFSSKISLLYLSHLSDIHQGLIASLWPCVLLNVMKCQSGVNIHPRHIMWHTEMCLFIHCG